MQRANWIIAAGVLGLLSVPTLGHAAAATTHDPGAFAALGTIYFSSVLDDAGIGSGQSGQPSSSGGIGHNSTGNLTNRIHTGHTTKTGGGSDLGTSNPGGIAPGNGPGGTDPSTPIFGDIGPENGSPGAGTGPHGGSGGGSTQFGDIGSHDPITDVHDGLPGAGGGHSADEIPPGYGYDPDQNTPPEITLIESSARIVQVPEPSSIALFVAGLLGLGWLNSRRKAR